MQPNGRGTLVKEIRMGDCEDPYLYAAGPILAWQETEEYNWLKTQCDDMVFFCDTHEYGFMIRVYAPLHGEALTYYNLKYLGIKE